MASGWVFNQHKMQNKTYLSEQKGSVYLNIFSEEWKIDSGQEKRPNQQKKHTVHCTHTSTNTHTQILTHHQNYSVLFDKLENLTN